MKRRKLEPMQQWTGRFETGYQYLRRALARRPGQSAPVPSSSSTVQKASWPTNVRVRIDMG
eukprot:9492478-Pyramimonas_sp.AAC.2